MKRRDNLPTYAERLRTCDPVSTLKALIKADEDELL
jgi:hypothetical protein